MSLTHVVKWYIIIFLPYSITTFSPQGFTFIFVILYVLCCFACSGDTNKHSNGTEIFFLLQ